MPHSIESWSSWLPGSVSCELRESASRDAILARSWPSGLAISARYSLRASRAEFSDPATAIHSFAVAPARIGTR